MKIDLSGKTFVLKHWDTPIMMYKVRQDDLHPSISVIKLFNSQKALFPMGLDLDDDAAVLRWLLARLSTGRKALIERVLGPHGIDVSHPLHILYVTKGLSLNDVYWTCEKSFPNTFNNLNLYDRKYQRSAARLSVGETESQETNVENSVADLSTGGVLPKAWVAHGQHLFLYKRGKVLSDKVDEMQPYSEWFAAQVAAKLCHSYVPYDLRMLFGKVSSVCPMFTSKRYGYVPIRDVVRKEKLSVITEYLYNLGKPFLEAFEDMTVFDYVVRNDDRHMGNYGFLIDNYENKIVEFAPVFDNGEGLFGRILDPVLIQMTGLRAAK